MIGIEVDIVSYVYDWQPGWVKCVFKDAHDKEWSIIEKVPIVSNEDLDDKTQYPRKGFVPGTVISKRIGPNKDELVLFSTETPWYIEAETGETLFEVYASQLIED